MRIHDLVESVLLEYDRNITAQKLGAGLLAKFKKEPLPWQQRIVNAGTEDSVVLDHLLGRVEVADPTKNKQYVPWIIRNYVNNPSLKFEDAVSKVTEPLQKFFKLVNKKQIPAPNNDIGRIKDLATLVQVVDQYPDVVDEPKNVDRGQAKPYYEDADLRVIIPQDQTAACYYGQGTKWCTASRENNMFDRYNREGEMYIVLPKKPAYPGEKYQFHFKTKQFMDERDRRTDVYKLVERYPQLRKIFANQAEEHNAIEFLVSKEEFDRAIKPAIADAKQDMERYIVKNQEELVDDIKKQLMRGAGRAERDVIYESMYELSALLAMGPDSLASVIVKMLLNHPELIGNDDEMSDQISNYIGDWVREEDFFAILEEYYNDEEDGDPDAWMDVAMTVEGELGVFVNKMIDAVIAGKIKQVLQR